MYFLCGAYVVLQALFNFYPYQHPTGSSFFFLSADPTLFSRDIIRTSQFGDTAFYGLMHFLLGTHVTRAAYLFWPYLLTCALIGLALFRIGQTLGDKNPWVGILLLSLFFVAKSPIYGAYIGITSADFNYQHFALGFSVWAICALLNEQYFYFSLLMASALYFHLKSPAAILLATLPLVVSVLIQNPKRIKSFLLPVVVALPRIVFIVRKLLTHAGFTLLEKKTYMQLVLPREKIEGSMYLNRFGVFNIVVYSAIAILGIYTVRAVANPSMRRRLYLLHAGVFFTFALGILVKFIDVHALPLGEIVILGYARASILGVLLSMGTIAAYAYNQFSKTIQEKNNIALWAGLTGFFFIALNHFFMDFDHFRFVQILVQEKLLLRLAVAAGLGGLTILMLKLLKMGNSIESLSSLVLLWMTLLLGARGVHAMETNRKFGLPLFPCAIRGMDPDEAAKIDVGRWANANVPKDALFLAVGSQDENGKTFACYDNFRIYSQRSVWCQNITAAYGDASAFREWFRRTTLLSHYENSPCTKWDALLENERIDYIVAPKNIKWPLNYRAIYENVTYSIHAHVPAPSKGVQ